MAITNNITGASPASTLDCCGDCDSPVLIGHIFQGDTMIPFSLEMPDGTTVEEVHSGNSAKVVDGLGVIEIEPAKHGQLIELKVREDFCQAISCLYVVSPKDGCVHCGDTELCDMKIKNLELQVVGDFYGDIVNLEVESYNPVEYKLENSGWVSNWREIPNFELNKRHILYLRSGDCTAEHEIFVESQVVYVPTTVYQAVPVSTPVVVNVPSQVLIPTPSMVLVGVPNLVPTPVAVVVNVPTAIVVPVGVPTPISTPISTPVVCPTPVAVPVGTPVSIMNAELTIIKAPSCFNGSNGALGLRVVGGTAPYTYAWTRNGSVSGVFSSTSKNRGFVNNSGLWQVVITDSLGQTLIKSVTLLDENTVALSTSNSSTQPSSDVSTDGSVSISGTGGTSPYKYYWSDNQSTSNSRSGLGEGSYPFLIADSKLCNVAYGSISITSTTAGFRAKIIPSLDIRNCNHNTSPFQSLSAVQVHGAIGESSSSYLWSNGAITSSLNNPVAGTYDVTVTSSLGNIVNITGYVHTVAPVTLMNISTVNSSGGLANGSITITSLSNMIGTVQQSDYLNTTTNEYYINPSALKTGNYTVTAFTDYGESITRTGVVIL